MSLQLWIIVIGSALGLLLSAIGAWLMFKNTGFDEKTTGEVVDIVDCEDTSKCAVNIKFADKSEKLYVKKALMRSEYEKGDKIVVMYDSSNPNNFYPGNPPVRMIGAVIGFIGLSILVGMIGWGAFLYIRQRKFGRFSFSSPLSSSPSSLSSSSFCKLNPSQCKLDSPLSSSLSALKDIDTTPKATTTLSSVGDVKTKTPVVAPPPN